MRSLLLSLALISCAPIALAGGGNAAAGATKSKTCHACHGVTGNGADPKVALYPKIGGQYRDYLEYALNSYKNGSRANAIMQGFATTLTAEDIADLAAYYASQQPELVDLSHIK